MSFLIDTQAFLWFEKGDKQLSEKAKSILDNDDNLVCISPATYWEISIKLSLGKLKLHTSFEKLYKTGGYKRLPIDLDHFLQLQKLPFHHRDPFDRIIAAQAIIEQLELISSDEIFDKYGVKRIW